MWVIIPQGRRKLCRETGVGNGDCLRLCNTMAVNAPSQLFLPTLSPTKILGERCLIRLLAGIRLFSYGEAGWGDVPPG